MRGPQVVGFVVREAGRRQAMSTAASPTTNRLQRLTAWSRTKRQHLFNVGVTTLTVILSSQIVQMKSEKMAVEDELKAAQADLDHIRNQTTNPARLQPLADILAVDVGHLQSALKDHINKPKHKDAAVDNSTAVAPSVV